MRRVKILVIGGTGTLGVEFLKQIQSQKELEVTVLSRDEHKHQKLKSIFPNVRFVIGDIRDKESLRHHFIDVTYVFHFAALKHIDVCEENPFESVKTNIIGTKNIADLCLEYKVSRCIFSSTDKAVDPISVYGYSKAIAESILLSLNKLKQTHFICYRWPNVTGSNGSFINTVIEKLLNGETIPITDVRMTRFFIKIENAVAFVIRTFQSKDWPSEVLIPDGFKSALITDVISDLATIMGKEYKTRFIGLRGVEKISECLMSQHSGKFLDSSFPSTRFSPAERIAFFRPYVVSYLEQKGLK